jgi:hypothetical protein
VVRAAAAVAVEGQMGDGPTCIAAVRPTGPGQSAGSPQQPLLLLLLRLPLLCGSGGGYQVVQHCSKGTCGKSAIKI